MLQDWFAALGPVLGLGTNVVAEIAVSHVAPRSVMRAITVGFAVGLAATAGLCGGDGAGGVLLRFLTYCALSFGYWAFINLNLTSLRIRVLRELYTSGGRMTKDELHRRYPPEEFLRRRLVRLEAGGHLRFDDGRWRSGSRTLLLVGRCIELWRAIILPRAAAPR